MHDAVGTAYIGPVRTSMDIAGDTVILIEENGKLQKIHPQGNNTQRQIHIISPVMAVGSVEHNGSEFKFTCKVMPDFKPGMELNKFVKAISETFKSVIEQKAKFRVPQLVSQISRQGKYTETLDTDFGNMPYKLIYTYTI